MNRRLQLTHGGFKDGDSFIVDPNLSKPTQAAFVAQPEIAALRTGRAVTRDANGYVIPATTAGQKVMGLIAFGFLDRLETREKANVSINQLGEGLTVVTGRFGTTLSEDMFDGTTDMKAGSRLYVAPSAGGLITVDSTGAVAEIGWVSKVTTYGIAVEISL